MAFALPLGKVGLAAALCVAPVLGAMLGALASRDVATALPALVVVGPLTMASALALSESLGWSLFYDDSVGWAPVVLSLPGLFIINTAAIAVAASKRHGMRATNLPQ